MKLAGLMVLTLAALAMAQNAPVQEKAQTDEIAVVATPLLSEQIATLETCAGKGCTTSATKLASLKSGCETQCAKTLAEKVRKLEASAARGCVASATRIHEMFAKLEGTTTATNGAPAAPLSAADVSKASVPAAASTTKDGAKCDPSKCDKVKDCDPSKCDKAKTCDPSKCDKSKDVDASKGDASKCDKAKTGADQVLAPAAGTVAQVALSAQVAQLATYSEKGCAASGTKLAAIAEACGGCCSKTVAEKIATLEGYAAKGCSESAEKIASLRAILDAPKN